MRRLSIAILVGLLCVPARWLHSQTAEAVARVAEGTITAGALAAPLAQLSVDSLYDRLTPSAALDRTARYLAAQLHSFGFGTAGRRETAGRRSDSAWILRYPIPGQRLFSYSGSSVSFSSKVMARGKLVATEIGFKRARYTYARFDRAAHFAAEVGAPVVLERAYDPVTEKSTAPGSDHVLLIAGPQTVASLAAADLAGRAVIYVPPANADTAAVRQVIAALYTTSQGVVVVRTTDSTTFASAVAAWQDRMVPVIDAYMRSAGGPRQWPWAVDVWPDSVSGILATVGVDLSPLRTATTSIVRTLPTVEIRLETEIDTTLPATPITAPILLALIPGTDSLLARECIVITTPMDTPSRRVPSTPTTARANDMNLAGMLALARAFRDPAARPRRSVLLIGVSGEVNDQAAWGSHFLAQDILTGNVVRGSDHYAAIAFDIGGAGGGDSVVIDGGAVLDLTRPPAWIAAMHSELGLTVVDEGATVARGADAFTRNYIPTLAVHRWGAADDPPVDAERAARLLRYVFYLGHELATTEQRPRWNAEGRRAFLRSR